MPDTSPVGDAWTWQSLGTGIAVAIASAIAWLGSRNGKKDKDNAVKSGAQSVASEFMDITVQRQIMHDTTRTADAVEALVSFYVEWRKEQDEAEDEAEKQSLHDRLVRIESQQETMSRFAEVFKRMDASEAEQKRLRKPP